jgi:hypothetical protein
MLLTKNWLESYMDLGSWVDLDSGLDLVFSRCEFSVGVSILTK